MPSAPTTFRAVIELWPSRKAMAVDLSGQGASEADVKKLAEAVAKWWQRDNIPPEWWAAVLGLERAVRAGLDADVMVRLAAREPAEARP